MVKISASKLKTFEGCSWQFFAKYHLKLPERPSDALSMGSACHKILEDLAAPEWENDVKLCILNKELNAKIIKLIKETGKQYKLPKINSKKEEVFPLVKEMILNGLLADFYVGGYKVIGLEDRFSLEKDGVCLNGIVDKIAYSEEKQKYIVLDFKTSRKQFEGCDLETNTQAMLYSMYIQEKFKKPCSVRFIFLRTFDNPIMEVSFSEDELNGYWEYLKHQASLLEKLDEKSALDNLAYLKEYPKDGSFSGPLMCGRAKSRNEVKKDGTIAWCCEFKHPFCYYKITENGKTKLTLSKPESGDFEELQYEGCPAFAKFRRQKPGVSVSPEDIYI